MKLSLAALAVVFSLAAFAEPLVGPEVILGGQFNGYALTRVAADSIAYVSSEAGAIRLVHYDRDLQVDPVTPGFVLPKLNPGSKAVNPAIASNGTTIAIVWNEQMSPQLTATVYAVVSRDFQTVLAGPSILGYDSAQPAVFAVGRTYALMTHWRFRLDEDFVLTSEEALPTVDQRIINSAGETATAENSDTVTCTTPTKCTQVNVLVFTSGSFVKRVTATVALSRAFPIQRRQRLSPNADAFLATWYEFGTGYVGVSTFTPSKELNSWRISGDGQSFDAAGNGADVVAASTVWWGGPLHVVVLHPDGTQTSPWVSGPALYPRVTPLSASEFIVTYEQVDNHYVIGGRRVTITSSVPDPPEPAGPPPPARRRAARH